MTPALALVTVAAGGLAAVARYLVSLAFAGRGRLPWAVLVVNAVGSALGGATAGLGAAGHITADLRLILLSGVAGGITTFSTWSVESVQLVEQGEWRTAAVSIAANLIAGIVVAAAAYTVTYGM